MEHLFGDNLDYVFHLSEQDVDNLSEVTMSVIMARRGDAPSIPMALIP